MPALTLPENTLGRDFVVSDIHGHFPRLEACLAARGFDPARDRLVAVGDLVDRGPQSARALEFLAQPWFFSVRGNHEQAMLDWLRLLLAGVPAAELREKAGRHAAIGGDWALPLMTAALRGQQAGAQADCPQRAEVQRWHDALAALPLALVIPRRGRHHGVVHATVPGGDWPAFCENLAQPGVAYLALWSRQPLDDGNICNGRSGDGVRGIDQVFAGHNRVATPQCSGNFCMIETGAWAGADLTLVDLDDWPPRAPEMSLAARLRRWLRRGPG